MKKIPFAVVKMVNIVLLMIPFLICWTLYYEPRTTTVGSKQVSVLVMIIFFLICYYFGQRLDCFRVSILQIRDVIFGEVLATMITDIIMYILIWMLSIHLPNLIPGLITWGGQCVIGVIWAYVMHQSYFSTHPPLRTIVIYDERMGMENLIHTYGLEKRFNIKTVYPVESIMDVKALCLTRFDEDDEAKKILDNLLEENADNAARYYYALGRIQKKQGKYNKAIELYKTAILNRRRYLSPYRELAECYILMDNISDAKIAIENAKKIDESNVFVILLEARLLQKEDCADKAIELLENQSIFEKEPAQIFFRKGRVFDQLGNKEQAKECYIRALDYDSKTYDAKLCLLNHQIIDEPLTAEEEMIALKNVLRGKRKFILTNIEARYVGYQKHNEEKAIEILDNVPKNFRDKQWYAVKRQLLENSIRKHSLAKRDILANEYTKELKKLDDVVEQKYGNINLREVDLLPDM